MRGQAADAFTIRAEDVSFEKRLASRQINVV